MRNAILYGLLVLPASATVLVAAGFEPLNVKTGLWQVSMTSKIDHVPGSNTSTYQSCITKEDLSRYPFTDPEAHCTWKVLKSTSSRMEAGGTCEPEGMGTVEFRMHLEAVDSENIRGTGQLSADGPVGPIDGSYAGMAKWIGPRCPAGMK